MFWCEGHAFVPKRAAAWRSLVVKDAFFCPQLKGWDWSQEAEWIVKPVERHFFSWSMAYICMSAIKDYLYFKLKPNFYIIRFTSELCYEQYIFCF